MKKIVKSDIGFGRNLNRKSAFVLTPEDKSFFRSLSFRSFCSFIVVILFVLTISNVSSYLVEYGQVTERDYLTNTYSTNTIDYTSFDSYCDMSVPVLSLTQGLLPKIDSLTTVLSTQQSNYDFEQWSKVHTTDLYNLQYGNVLERAVWSVASPFTRLYYNIVVRGFMIPDLIELIDSFFNW